MFAVPALVLFFCYAASDVGSFRLEVSVESLDVEGEVSA
jgi:hypothetical protein